MVPRIGKNSSEFLVLHLKLWEICIKLDNMEELFLVLLINKERRMFTSVNS